MNANKNNITSLNMPTMSMFANILTFLLAIIAFGALLLNSLNASKASNISNISLGGGGQIKNIQTPILLL